MLRCLLHTCRAFGGTLSRMASRGRGRVSVAGQLERTSNGAGNKARRRCSHASFRVLALVARQQPKPCRKQPQARHRKSVPPIVRSNREMQRSGALRRKNRRRRRSTREGACRCGAWRRGRRPITPNLCRVDAGDDGRPERQAPRAQRQALALPGQVVCGHTCRGPVFGRCVRSQVVCQ